MKKLLKLGTIAIIVFTISINGKDTNEAKEFVLVEELEYDTVLATKYNPLPEQCWGDPLITADMSKICLTSLEEYKIRWIAVSRDLLIEYGYSMGDTIIVCSDNEKLNGEWVIHDKMAKRWKKKIDFLVPVNDNYNFHSPIKLRIRKKRAIALSSFLPSFFF